MKPITICALFFNSYTDLARRCLDSICKGLADNGGQFVQELRFGLNVPSLKLAGMVMDWAQRIRDQFGIRCVLFDAPKNKYKYPMMRRMFFQRPLETEYVMWFDDDSFLVDPLPKRWWATVFAEARSHDMIGQHWLMPVQGNQLEWIKTQPWFNPNVQLRPPKSGKGKPAFEFCQGAWWVIRTSVLQKYDWPIKEIRHNGGDSMLGELFRHQGLRMGRFYGGVRINADEKGRHSKSKRRGHSENRVGWDFKPGQAIDLSFQDFETGVVVIDGGPTLEAPINLFET